MTPATPQPARISTDRLRELRAHFLHAVGHRDIIICLDELIAAREALRLASIDQLATEADLNDANEEIAKCREIVGATSEHLHNDCQRLVDELTELREATAARPSEALRELRELREWLGRRNYDSLAVQHSIGKYAHGQCIADVLKRIDLMLDAAPAAAPAVPPTSDEVEAAIEAFESACSDVQAGGYPVALRRLRDLCRGAQQPDLLARLVARIKRSHNGYDPEARAAMAPHLKEPATIEQALDELLTEQVQIQQPQQPAPSELLRAAANILKDLDEAFAAGRGFYPAFSPANVGALRAAVEHERKRAAAGGGD
jgi:hypothetical protein